MRYQEQAFSLPKISISGPLRLNLNAAIKHIFVSRIPELKENLILQFSAFGSYVSGLGSKLSTQNGGFKFKKFIPIFVFGLFVLGTGFLVYRRISGFSANEVQVKGAKATQETNKEFSFPLKDENGTEVSRFGFVVEKVELRDEIIVQGKRATSVSGRTFLIVNLKITNQYNQSIKINTRDFIRLATTKDKVEWLAPDIHNDPVEVQPIATKYTRVGFAINDSDRDLTLRIGEINGEKEEIVLSVNK
jgi:hypothetical protein